MAKVTIAQEILNSKTEGLVKLLALATNEFNNKWSAMPTFTPLADARFAAFERDFNDPKHDSFGNTALKAAMEAQAILDGNPVTIRSYGSLLQRVEYGYGVVVVPTAPAFGEMPAQYTDAVDNGYVLGQPYVVVNAWSKRASATESATARGKSNAKVSPLNAVPLLPTRSDCIRPATDDEIKQVVADLIEARGAQFILDVTDNIPDSFKELLEA
jgi:hypothetical protein